MKMAMIVAMDEDGCIGKQGDLPWRLKSDMIRFKTLTEADGYNAVIMGRKTWDSLPGALPGRENWVLSRSMKPTEGIRVFNNFDRVLENASGKTLFVIGGGELYRQTLSYCKEIFVTEVL